jgi:NAD(P)-dependent dehydrogenase (short-subunit alcohol dehydrogenase family)
MKPNLIFDLTGKVALVTGGAGHSGAAYSQALAEHGARVIVASPNLKKCQKFAAELGPPHEGAVLDLDDHSAVIGLVDDIVRRHGSLDVLVNNGYKGSYAGIGSVTPEEFATCFSRGLTSYFLAARQAVRHMKEGDGGSIINIASMYGMVGGYPTVYEGLSRSSPPHYHAMKGAIISLTRQLAVNWASYNIRVNSISPGPFPLENANLSAKEKEFHRRLCERVPLGRIGKPHELKGAVVLLASHAGSYITGHNLVVDGGWTAW